MLGSVVTDAPVPRTSSPVRGRLRLVPPVPRRLPDGRDHRARCGRRPALPVVAAAGRGAVPVEHRVALGDRIYGCDECQEVCPPNRRAPATARDRRRGAVGRPADAPRPDDDVVLGRARPLVHPAAARSATCAATRWWCSATSVTADDPVVVAALDALPRATTTRCCGATPSGRRAASDARICSRRSSRRPIPLVARRAVRGHSDDPPVRHQRLPAEDRRHPVDALGAVAAARPDDVRGAHHALRGRAAWDAEQPFRVVRTQREVLLPDAVAAPPDRRAGRRGRAPTGACSIPALPLGLLGPRLAAPVRRRAPRRRGHRARPAARPEPRCSRHVLRGAELVIARRWLPAGRGRAGRRRGRCRRVARPAGRRHRAVPPARRRRSGRRPEPRFGLPVDGPLVVSVSRLVPRKGMDVLIQAAAPLAPRHPDLTVAIAGAGRDRARLERLVASTGAPVRLLGRVSRRRPARALRLRRRVRHAVPQPLGRARAGGLRHRVPRGGRRRRATGRRATAVARPRPWSTARPGLVVDRPDDVDAVAGALDELLDDPDRRARMGVAGRERADRRVLLRRPRRSPGDALARVGGWRRWLTEAGTAIARRPGDGPWRRARQAVVAGTGAHRRHQRGGGRRPDTFGVGARGAVGRPLRGRHRGVLWAYALGRRLAAAPWSSRSPGCSSSADGVAPAVRAPRAPLATAVQVVGGGRRPPRSVPTAGWPSGSWPPCSGSWPLMAGCGPAATATFPRPAPLEARTR